MVRLFCDGMLAGLARWLRAAGCDTALAARGLRDTDILAACRAEGRTLLTRDRRLAAVAAGDVPTVLVESDAVDEQARQVGAALWLDWMAAPFTRCMVDNAPLRPATGESAARIPERARRLPGPFRVCPACGRVYWPGSHARRIAARLQAWREAVAAERRATAHEALSGRG